MVNHHCINIVDKIIIEDIQKTRGDSVKGNKRQLHAMLFVFAIIILAYTCRMLDMYDIGGGYPGYVRAALYIFLFALWGYSIDRRIIQKQVLHYLRWTDALMLFWLIIRTLKYEVVTDLTVARYIWYLYYLPMLFIPMLGVYIAISLGKPEQYRLSGKTQLLIIIPTLLFLSVITNDLHQKVFAFKSGIPGIPDNSSYYHNVLYFFCLAWMVGCMIFTIVYIFKKSRVSNVGKRRIMPFVFCCLIILYGVLYLIGIPQIRFIFGDMNVMNCLIYAAIYESCIHCRMIPSNTGYVELFEATTLASCIADKNGQIVLRSRAAGEDMVCPEKGKKILRPDGMRISSSPVKGGFVVWADNIQPLLELRTWLNENKVEIEKNKKKLQQAYQVQKQLYELTEKNHIYEKLERIYKKQTDRIQELLILCENSEPSTMREYMKEILLIGTYIKRSANLLFLSEEYEVLPQQELRLTVDEAVRAVTACGTECGVIYRTTKPMRSAEVVRLFELLHIVSEKTVGELQSLFISVSDEEMNLSVECNVDLSVIASKEVTVCQDDGLWMIRTQIGGQGNA